MRGNFISLYSLNNTNKMRTPLLWVLLLTCVTNYLNAQDITIQLQNDPKNYQPQNFYITEVVDSRTFKTKLGKIKEGDIHLNGGEAAGLTNYFKEQFKKPVKGLPVTIHLNTFTIKEKAVGSRRQFDLSVGIAYYSNGQKLVEYNGSAYVQTSSAPLPQIEKLVRSNLINNLEEFDTWLEQNKLTVSAGPSVKVNVQFAKSSKDKNIIYYQKDKKLFITDFIAPPDSSSYGAAATFSGIHMNYKSTTMHRQTTVDVTLSVFFDRSKSWMKPQGKNASTLRHEQRHFDITALKACELKKLIEQKEFTPANYQQELKKLLYKIQEEAGSMQNSYDEETYHGTIIDAQEKWNNTILEELGKQQCFY